MKKSFNHLSQPQVLASAISGTTVMTLFSYLLSDRANKNFREPKLLGRLCYRLLPVTSKKNMLITGWVLHYLVGLLFAECYSLFWTGNQRADVKTGMVLGGISGFAAILIWKFTYALHPNPPLIDFTSFALQLVIAHLLFGIFAAFGYNAGRRYST